MTSSQQSDIMSRVLTSGSMGGDPIPVLDELTQLIRLYSPIDDLSPGAGHHSPSLLQRLMPSPVTSRKGSYTISKKILEHLESTTKEIRQLRRKGDKHQITKSKIVEYALELLLDDYKRSGQDSILAKKFLNGHAPTP